MTPALAAKKTRLQAGRLNTKNAVCPNTAKKRAEAKPSLPYDNQ